MSQERQIYRHMKNHRTITPIEALRLFGCFRLGARIFNLRKKYPIKSRRVRKGNKTFAEYRLA